ncbi:aminodeoxychorismate lyase [Lederbergia lenta]|uniref:aminodeoxychorismate lyase n=1 Tax=Lederbergia lenta TaxID=1467 RepID=UPI0020411594|nr:aminodeoxychorismate lyase [Lederbergia lenta]MCM3110992.1 aminodeoxychorismate lyase [Lederbergia lenta]
MYIYLNGKYIKKEEANISPFDHGYLYGLGVFETIRTYQGHPFLLDEHLGRLNAGLDELNISKRFEYAEVLEIVEELSRLNGLQDSYIRFNVSAGVGEIGLQAEEYDSPTVIMFQKPLPQMERLKEKEAVVLKLRRNTPETATRLKSHHFFNNVAAKRELGPDPNKEGILLSESGFLAEGVTSNLFWLKDKVLLTPALETGILNGITRQFVLKLAERLEMTVNEGLYQAADLEKADEIFFTNSIQEIIPVHQLGLRKFPGKNGDYVKTLYQLYQNQVLSQTRK